MAEGTLLAASRRALRGWNWVRKSNRIVPVSGRAGDCARAVCGDSGLDARNEPLQVNSFCTTEPAACRSVS